MDRTANHTTKTSSPSSLTAYTHDGDASASEPAGGLWSARRPDKAEVRAAFRSAFPCLNLVGAARPGLMHIGIAGCSYLSPAHPRAIAHTYLLAIAASAHFFLSFGLSGQVHFTPSASSGPSATYRCACVLPRSDVAHAAHALVDTIVRGR